MYRLLLLLCTLWLCIVCVSPAIYAGNRFQPPIDVQDVSGRSLFIRTLYHRGIHFMISDEQFSEVTVLVYAKAGKGIELGRSICYLADQYDDFVIDVLYVMREDSSKIRTQCKRKSVKRSRRERRIGV